MHTFAQRSNAPQQTGSDSPMLFSRLSQTQSRDLNSNRSPQMTDNQTIQRPSVHSSQTLGFNHDFSRVPVHSMPDPTSQSSARFDIRSEPVKQPDAPKPQKDEKRLGTLKDKQTGVEENIYPSFVTSGLWWFNDGTPTLADLYPTTANIPVDKLGKGKFSIKVTKGSDKVALDGGGSTLTGTDLTKFNVKSLAPSTKAGDVTIEITHRAPDAKTDDSFEAKMDVRAPHHLELLGTDHVAKGKWGYSSWTSLRVFDNFGKPMPYIDVNEDFSGATIEKGVTSEWKDGMEARTKGHDVSRSNAVFKDQYGVAPDSEPPASTTPQPSNPKTPLGKTKVGSFTHDWYVGSGTTGKGVHVSHHIGMFYADHAEYTSFTSPPAAAKKP